MRTLILALVRDFCCEERLKLRRFLIDRIRWELDLNLDEAEREVACLEADGLIRPVEISHYDSASEDITIEAAVVAHRRLFEGHLLAQAAH